MSAATLTPADLDAIEARANAATPGPWRRAPSLGIDSEVRAERHDALTLCAEIHAFPDGGDPRADADFIASSRADVPRLVAALRAAELARATLTRDLREAVSTVDELHNANDGATVDQATARADAPPSPLTAARAECHARALESSAAAELPLILRGPWGSKDGPR